MLPKKPKQDFGLEPPTMPSSQSPLRSGKHPSFREPPPVEEVSPPAGTGLRRRYSAERETPRKPTTRELEEEAAPTPRPRVSLAHVPRVIMHETEIMQLPLVARTGFLISLIDGKTPVQTIIDIAGMETKEVLRLLDELFLFGVIAVK